MTSGTAWVRRSRPAASTTSSRAAPGHRANILKASYRDLGIGVHAGVPDDAGVGTTVTTDFGVRA